jgi:hypothetical protein
MRNHRDYGPSQQKQVRQTGPMEMAAADPVQPVEAGRSPAVARLGRSEAAPERPAAWAQATSVGWRRIPEGGPVQVGEADERLTGRPSMLERSQRVVASLEQPCFGARWF